MTELNKPRGLPAEKTATSRSRGDFLFNRLGRIRRDCGFAMANFTPP